MFASSSPTMRVLPLVLFAALALSACDTNDEICPIEGTAPATATSTVTVDYVGQLEDRIIFDQGICSSFRLDGVITGFREGIVGMIPGEEKVFVVPPEKGYGSAPQDGIPANSTLTFTVRLRSVR